MLASPWFAGVHAVLAQLPAERWPSLAELDALARDRGVASGGGAPLRFVPATGGATGQHYEQCIYRTGAVATRAESEHDLFNALVWLAFPRTKARLNRLHYDEIERLGNASPTRGTARDVATLFDEGGMLVACSARPLSALLCGFQWRELFWERRADVARGMRFLVFGHAVLEHALTPHKAVTAKALVVDVDDAVLRLADVALVDLLDAAAAQYFAMPAAGMSTRTLQPLPVLGIPGWSPDSAQSSYYDDTNVFRPGRMKQAP